jgi:coenzyme F420-0:L-glutamate ligase
MEVAGVKSRIIKEKDDLLEVLQESLKKNKVRLKEKDVLVIASKVLAVSQGRVVPVRDLDYKKGHLKEIIQKEGGKLFETNYCWLTYKDGHLIPNAGVDKSNVKDGKVVLWPKNVIKHAREIQESLRKTYKLRNLGVIISDSTTAPLRPGVHGISLGSHGFIAVEDCRGHNDIYGKKMMVTRRAMADSLATAAIIIMGETNARIPFAIVRGAPVKFTNKKVRRQFIPLKSDLFYGMYNNEFRKFLSRKK